MIRFEVGKVYPATALYGGLPRYLCVSRTEKTVTLEEVGFEEVEIYNIEVFDECEVVLYWEYKGEKCYIWANR